MTTVTADKALILPSSVAPGRVFLSPIPITYSMPSDTTAASQRPVMIAPTSRKTAPSRDEECCFYYSKISSTMDEEEDEDSDTTLSIKDDCTVFSETPSSLEDTVSSPASTVAEEKLPSPPLSPPLSPTTLSTRPRFPRWIKQISAPSIMASSTATSNHGIPSRELSFKTSLLPPRLMRRMMMPPNVQHVAVALPAATALYYGSTHVREYLHEVMKPNRFDEMLLSGFDSMCPVHSMEFDDDEEDSIMTGEIDDTASCQCDHQQMTLRITLTPFHCRATETEIYGHNSPSHRGKRPITASVSTPTRSTTTVAKKYPKDPTPTLSLPPLPRHDSRPPLYVVNPSQPHVQPKLATKSSFYCNHHPPVLVLPTNPRRHPQK